MENCKRGNEYFAQGKYNDALKMYKLATAQDTNNATYWSNQARASLKLRLFRMAISEAQQAISCDANNVQAHITKLQALRELGKTDEAEECANVLKQLCIADIMLYELAQQYIAGTIIAEQASQQHKAPKQPTILPKHDNFNRESISADEIDDNILQVAASKLQGGVGDINIDKLIIMGYFKVNNGQYKEAIQHFDKFIQLYPNIVAGYVARGTAYALLGQLDAAITNFSHAINCDPKCADAWKRRGQARSAKGEINEAITDVTQAIKLQPTDADAHSQRGQLMYNVKDYRRALNDFLEAVKLQPKDRTSWNFAGLCYNHLGSCLNAVQMYEKAVTLDPKFKEAWINMAQAYRDWGNFESSESTYSKVLASVDPNCYQTYFLRSLARYGAGRLVAAFEDAARAKELKPSSLDSVHLKSIALHNLGQFRQAVIEYNDCIRLDPTFFAFYQREIAIRVHELLDTPIGTVNLDNEFDPYFKEAWSKRTNPAHLSDYIPKVHLQCNLPDVALKPTLNADQLTILKLSEPFGRRIQLETPGFLVNLRQHRMCGLAVLEMAQTLRQHWRSTSVFGDSMGLVVDGKNSSILHGQPHLFGWRDFFDIAVKWRQVSEPNDPVWWIDKLAPELFEEGFGLQTPMYSGQMKVPRYYPYYHKALEAIKVLALEQWALTDEMREKISKATTCDEVHSAMKRDFWVVTQVLSTSQKSTGGIMEGTRLTVQKRGIDGYEFTIRTPAKPNRWVEFNAELTFLWNELAKEARTTHNFEKLTDLIMRLYFYWVNFGPMTRGTAALGLIGMMALFLAAGIEIESVCKKGKQLDFESIIGGDPEAFIKEHGEWLYPLRKTSTLLDQLPCMRTHVPTLRAVIELLNYNTL